MDGTRDYEKIGRFIYGFVRVKGGFDSFCQAVERGSHPIAAETPVSELADRVEAVLTLRYGTGSLIVSEFIEVANIMRACEDRMSQLKEGFRAGEEPDEAEAASMLSCQQKLDHIWQMMSAE